MFKKYLVYFEDRDNVYRAAIPAKTKKDAEEYAKGNGEIVAVKDVTDDYPIGLVEITGALRMAGFGEIETDLVCRTLEKVGIATW